MKAETAIFLVIRFASLCVPPRLPHPLLLPSSILLSLVLQGREGGRAFGKERWSGFGPVDSSSLWGGWRPRVESLGSRG
ncbi:unnamed protein product [Musa acuminata var. zebrina]